MKKVAIVIPRYREKLTTSEKQSYKHLIHYLNEYDKYWLMPDNLKLEKVDTQGLKQNFKSIKLPAKHFEGVKTYSKLLLIQNFYKLFSDYQYILIYQLDALVFKNELKYWCDQNYDYIGAPLLNSKIGWLTHPQGKQNAVGNGGLSLRKVSSFIKVLDQAKQSLNKPNNKDQLLNFWLKTIGLRTRKKWLTNIENYPFNEDGFWSFEAIKYWPKFKVPSVKTALKFAFETQPQICYQLNEKQLPFGCHAWVKYNKKIWKPFLL